MDKHWGTASVADGLKHGTSIVMLYICALKIREAIDPPFLEEEGSYVSDMDASVEAELTDGCNCTC